jgi:hypothetical protein
MNNHANSRSVPGSLLLVACSLVLGAGLVWLGTRFPLPASTSTALNGLAAEPPANQSPAVHFGVQALKLVFAALIGAVVSAVHRRHPGEKPIARSLAQAQVLLCVAGALMMIIIGDSLARALGIAGGATIVRFRTPVEDPKDTTVLFLLLGLGMACGLGAFAVAGFGTGFLCACLVLLDLVGERQRRAMLLEMVAPGAEFPTDYVNRLLAAYQIQFEPREVGQRGEKATITYYCTLDPDTPLERLSEQLMDPQAAGLKSVSWEMPRKP